MKTKIQKLAWSLLGTAVICSLVFGGWAALADGAGIAHLRIEGSSETLFSGNVEVGDCDVTDASGVLHSYSGTAVCGLTNALSKVGIDAVFQDFGFGLFLETIGQDVTPADWSYSWSFWVNGEPASVGVDSYVVGTGDELLLTFSVFPTIPLIVDVPETITVNEPFNIEINQVVGDYDANFVWQGGLLPATEAKLWVDDTSFAVGATGLVEVVIDEVGEIEVWAESTGKVRSLRHVVQALSASPSPSPSLVPSISPSPSLTPSVSPVPSVIPSPSISPSPSPSPTVINEVSREQREQAAQRALTYLRENQDTDGTIGGTVVSGWTAMAFRAAGQKASNVSLGGATLWDGLLKASLTRVTDIERQIMAIRAAGGDPRSWQERNLVQDLKAHFKQGQFGEEALINDDIFGVLALLAADESIAATELRQGVNNIISWQEEKGSWGNIDLAAAAIQALREYEARGGDINVRLATEKARDYLKDQQDNTGGFSSNSASTAWGIQAILSLGEDPNDWSTSLNKTPWHAILDYQKDNGGISWKLSDQESTFMTAYAVPALLGVPWPIQALGIDEDLVKEEQAATQSYTEALFSNTDTLAQPSVAPKVAGTSTVVEAAGNKEGALKKVYALNEESDSIHDNEVIQESESINKIDPRRSDRRFAFTLFGLVNMAVGVTVARLVMRI